MSYNPAYGQPMGQMMPALPFPTNQLIAQPMLVQPGQPPFLPSIPYLPQPLQQAYPFVVSEAMNALSAKAQENPLRTFLFNQVVANNWQNQDFLAFLDGLVRMIEVKMSTGQFRDVMQCISTCAVYFAELNTAANVVKFPALEQGMDQNARNAVQTVLRELSGAMGEMNQFYSRQGQPPQPMQAQWNDPNAYRPVTMQPQQAWTGQPAPQQANWRQVQQSQQLAQAGVSTVNTTRGYGQDVIDNGDPVASRYGRRSNHAQRPSHQVTATQEVRQERREAIMSGIPGRAPAAAQPQPSGQLATGALLTPSETVKFVPSEDIPVNVAFDPNLVEVYYQVTDKGTLNPAVKKKAETDMDMSKHLSTPSFVTTPPAALEAVDSKVRALNTEKALQDDVLALAHTKPMPDVEVAYKDEAMRADVSMDELWLNNEVQLALMRKNAKKINVYRSLGVKLVPHITTKDSKSMINAVAQAQTFEAACKLLRTFEQQLKDGVCSHGDDKTLTFINQRLTMKVNDWLKKSLAVNKGWMTSFMEDAMAVPQFIADRVGSGFGKKVVEAQADIISRALRYVEEEFERQQNSNLLGEVTNMEKLLEGVNITYFFDYVTLTSLDLYSPELRFDIPKGSETSVGIFQAQTPLLRQIADNTFTHERALEMKFDRHLVRTADGVLLELTLSAMNPQFYLVCVVDA